MIMINEKNKIATFEKYQRKKACFIKKTEKCALFRLRNAFDHCCD